MSADMNVVALVGNLTRDAELSYTPSGGALLKFGVAVNSMKKVGESWEDEVHFFDCTFFGSRGEKIAKYLTKGFRVGVTGSLRLDRWQDKQTNQNRQKVWIRVDDVQFLSCKDAQPSGNGYQGEAQGVSAQYQKGNQDNFDDSIPF
ncbi:single strand DNA binding protein [Rhodobacteraceae phage LS06-2018-MD07]|nr:single strand DNA binding protein [Rhodobacteraceae phage LS06-2018-MD07]